MDASAAPDSHGEHDYEGWLLKGAPRLEDDDKQTSLARKLRSVANALVGMVQKHGDFKRRYFVLDGNEIRYYRDETMARQSGSIDLGTVLDVRYADDPRVPAFAFQLVTDARTFTLAPSPASQEAAAEWFNRIAHRIETGRKRGLLARSLRNSRRPSAFGTFAGGQQFGADKKSKDGKGKGDASVLPSLILPLYLSHETCRLPPEAVLQGTVNLTAAGGGATAWSGLQRMLEGHDDRKPSGTAGGVATGTVAVLNALAYEASAKAGTVESTSMAMAQAGGPLNIKDVGEAASLPPEALARRGSRAYALPDYSAPPVTSVDPLRKDRPAFVSKRRGSTGGINATGLATSPSMYRLSVGKPSLADRLAAVSGDGPRPVSLGFSRSAASTATGAKQAVLHKRRARVVSRWEEISGNVPRWCVSAVNEHRLKHLPMFAPVLGLGPGQVGWLPDTADGNSGAGKGSTEEYAVLGKLGAKEAKKAAKAAKKAAKAKAKAKKKAAKAKAKVKADKKGKGGDDSDDEDEDEEEDEEEEEEGDSDDGADESAYAATGMKMRRAPSSASLLLQAMDDGEDTDGSTGRMGAQGRAQGRAAALAQAITKRATRDIRQRVELMAVTATASGAEELAGGAVDEDPAPFVPAAVLAATLPISPSAASTASGLPSSWSSSLLPPLPSGLRPGARGFEVDLLLALSSKERAHLAYTRSQLAEHARLGWEVAVGVQDMPTNELVRAEPDRARIGGSASGTPAIAGARSPAGSMRLGMTSGLPSDGTSPTSPVRVLSDTSAIADFAAAAAKHASALLLVTTPAAVTGAAAQLTGSGPASRRSNSTSDPGSVASVYSSNAPSRRVSEAPLPAAQAQGQGQAGTQSLLTASLSVPVLSAANRPTRTATRAMRSARLEMLATHGAGHLPAAKDGAHGKHGHGHGDGEDVAVRPLTGDQARAGRAFIESRGAAAGPDALARADEMAQAAIKAAADPTAAPTVAARWPPGGKVLMCTEAPGQDGHSKAVPSEDGFPTSLLAGVAGMLGPEPAPAPVSPRSQAYLSGPTVAPTLRLMSAARAGWEGAAKEEEDTPVAVTSAAGLGLATPRAAGEATPSAAAGAGPATLCDRASRLAALRLAATVPADTRQAAVETSGGDAAGAGSGSVYIGQGRGYDMWSISTAKDDPAIHGAMYGLAGSRGVNPWEDPVRTHGLPPVLRLDGRMHGALFGPAAPSALVGVLAVDPYGQGTQDTAAGPVSGGASTGAGASSSATVAGGAADPSGAGSTTDFYEAALSYWSFHNVPAGTVLHRAQLPYAVPAVTTELGSAPLLGDQRSVYVLLHGRVRVHTGLPSGDGVARVFDSRRAWRALRHYIRVQAAFKYSGLKTLMASAPHEERAKPTLARVHSSWEDKGMPSPAAKGKAGKGKAASVEPEGTDSQGTVSGLTAAPTVGQLVSSPGMWVEVSSVAGPLVLGAAALARYAPHASTVVTAGPCMLLELRPVVWPRLCRAFPSVATGLGLLGSLGLHDPAALIGCVPSLVPAFAETGQACPAGNDRWPLICSLAALFRPVTLSVGEPLYQEGDVADCAYVVVSGQIALSSRCANSGGHTVLAVYSRGGCVGDSALGNPGRRTTRAVAMTSSLVLRITHASLKGVLSRRRRVWRAVRNAALWRDASQLVRLPLLAHLVGGDEETGRLAPLSDLFRPVVLDTGASRHVVPGAFPRTPVDPSSARPWDVTAWTKPELTAEDDPRAAGQDSGPGADSAFPVGAMLLPDLRCLLLVQHGSVETVPKPGFPGAQTQVLGPADWLGGSTLFTARHEGEAISLKPVVAGSEATAGCIAPARGPINSDGSGYTPSGSSPTCAVLLGVPRHSLDVFISTLPQGGKRLKLWRDTNGKVELVMALANSVLTGAGAASPGGKGKGKGPVSAAGPAAEDNSDWAKKGKKKGVLASSPARPPVNSFAVSAPNPLLGRMAAGAAGGDTEGEDSD